METSIAFNARKYLLYTIINTVLNLLLFVASIGVWMANIMAAANNNGSSATLGMILIFSSFLFPAIPIISIALFWLSFIKKSRKYWLIFSFLPWAYSIFMSILVVLYFMI